MKRLGFVLLLALACREAAPPPQQPAEHPLVPKIPSDAPERQDLLNFAYGASVVSRTGELMLENSALRAIDGDPTSFWTSPPDETRDHALVFSLPAPARIAKVGVRTSDSAATAVRSVRIALSRDGRSFTEAGTFATKLDAGPQLFDITPAEASFVRVEPLAGGERFIALMSIHARGEWLSPPQPGDLAGCWSVNGSDAAFVRDGSRASGTMRSGTPLLFEGGSDGRFYRFVWTRGPEFGLAAISVTPGGDHLAGMAWHEEAIPLFFGTVWYGDRRPCASPWSAGGLAGADVLRTFLTRANHVPLYGLRFDDAGALDESESASTLTLLASLLKSNPGKFRITSREFRHDANRNRALAQARLDSLRSALARRGLTLPPETFAAFGSDQPRQKPDTETQRALFGVVALELVR